MSQKLVWINKPIEDKEKIIEEVLQKRKENFSPEVRIGLIYFKPEKIQKLFDPLFKEYGRKLKVTRAWAHFMERGGFRASHQHTEMTALYYLKIPKNSAKMKNEETGEIIEPKEDSFCVFPSMLPHSLSEHKSDEIRLAIAMDCEEYG